MAFALTNHAILTGSSSATATVSPGWTLTAGHLIVVAVATEPTTVTAVTVSDSAGNTYTVRASAPTPGGSNTEAFFLLDSVLATGGSGVTITASFGVSVSRWAVVVLDYSFAGTIGYGATSAATNASASRPADPGSLVLSGPNRLVVSGCSVGTLTTYTAASGFTIEESAHTAGVGHIAVQDATGQSGTVSPTIGLQASAFWAAAAASYYEIAVAKKVPYGLIFRGSNAHMTGL